AAIDTLLLLKPKEKKAALRGVTIISRHHFLNYGEKDCII
ncbi:Hypothetical protein EIN_401210, partial [Entamoeba invadens IP1]